MPQNLALRALVIVCMLALGIVMMIAGFDHYPMGFAAGGVLTVGAIMACIPKRYR